MAKPDKEEWSKSRTAHISSSACLFPPFRPPDRRCRPERCCFLLASTIKITPCSLLVRRRSRGGRKRMEASSVDWLCIVVFVVGAAMADAGDGDVTASPVLRGNGGQRGCRLDLSNELFGGVGDACVRGRLDRSRCCPVLAAWLFAAHARSALELPAAPEEDEDDAAPMMPEDNQQCVKSLQSALEKRDIRLPQPNATCDTVLCFCGIRLHRIGPLRCPAAFNLSGGASAIPTAAVQRLERDCRNASYAGCSRCLLSLDKVKKGNGGGGGDGGDRAARMFARDCELMGLTWLLTRNKTAYIPTVSAVLRAMLYTDRPASGGGRCSRDLENMPLAVDSLQFQHFGVDDVISAAAFSALRPVDVLLLASFATAIVLPRVPFLSAPATHAAGEFPSSTNCCR